MTLKVLDLSTGHLKPSTREWLNESQFNEIPLALMRGPYGFMIWVSDEDPSGGLKIPNELGKILSTPMPGIEYVRFDADAKRHPLFDWYGDAELIKEAGNPDAPLDNCVTNPTPRIGLGETIKIDTDGATIEVMHHIEGDAVRLTVLKKSTMNPDPVDYADVSMPSKFENDDDLSM